MDFAICYTNFAVRLVRSGLEILSFGKELGGLESLTFSVWGEKNKLINDVFYKILVRFKIVLYILYSVILVYTVCKCIWKHVGYFMALKTWDKQGFPSTFCGEGHNDPLHMN